MRHNADITAWACEHSSGRDGHPATDEPSPPHLFPHTWQPHLVQTEDLLETREHFWARPFDHTWSSRFITPMNISSPFYARDQMFEHATEVLKWDSDTEETKTSHLWTHRCSFAFIYLFCSRDLYWMPGQCDKKDIFSLLALLWCWTLVGMFGYLGLKRAVTHLTTNQTK